MVADYDMQYLLVHFREATTVQMQLICRRKWRDVTVSDAA